jgi:signal transduction histidine kinase
VSATRETILYIEDDPASRMLVERTLKYAGYNVLVAENGLDGIDIARRVMPDLVLTDINLPDISGREITTMLRSDSRFQNTPIVALTAQAFDEQRELTMASGITGYLTKPIDIETLADRMQHYLRGGRDQIDESRLAEAQKRYTQEIVRRLEERIRELEATNEALRRLDKMKDTFIQLTAHELRTPLTLVYGYSRLLEDSPSVRDLMQHDPSTQTLLRGLVEAIERMQGIINEILTISRIMTNQIDMSIGPVSPARLVERVADSYRQALETRRLSLHYDPTGWPDKIRADGELLVLALSNLVSNAIKYTPDTGHITITVQPDGDDHICLCVRDTGIGVPPEEHLRIFDRFHTASDTMLHSTSKTAFGGGGLGLGLAVCKNIVEAHGGRVWVESPGLDRDRLPGSAFFIRLPLAANAQNR